MTCREKLKIEHPDKVNNITGCGCTGCPSGYGYLPNPYYCKHHGDPELCTKCWDREIPEIEEIKEIKEEVKMDTNKTYTFEDVRRMNEYEKTDLIMELQKDKADLETKCGRLNEENFGLKLENNLEKSSKSDREIFIEKIKKEKTDLVDCIKKRNESIVSLKKENEKLKGDRDFLNLDTGRLNDEIKEKDKEIEKLKNENKNLADCNDVLNDRIIEYEFVIEEADKKKAELEDKNRKLKEEIKMGKERKYYTYTEIRTMTDFAANALIANLQNDIYIKDKECDELKVKLNAKDAEIHYLRSMYDDVDEKFEELRKDSSQLISKNVDLESTIKLKNKDLEDKNEQINHLIERLDEQRKKIEDLENGDVLPYFIRKVVGDKLKVDPLCWATPAEKCNHIGDPICKSVPCSEAIKQLEKKVDDIPCIKAKNTKNELDDAIKDYIMKSPKPVCWDDYWPINHLGEWNLTNPTYDKTATHMMRKYKALRNAGFDHDDAMSLIPMWLDE